MDDLPDEIDNPINPVKAGLLTRAIERYKLRSLIDVGACWGVNGGYTFHALRCGVSHGTIADGNITRLTRNRASGDNRIELREGSLGEPRFVESLPRADAAVIFDVLLHQVSPDWDEFLDLYAQRVDHFVIYNQDWIGGPDSVRFVDRGLDWYLANVGNSGAQDIAGWFSRHQDFHPEQKKPWRDLKNFWQWGITPSDLISAMSRLGFRLDYFENYGLWSEHQPHICVDGYLFARQPGSH